MSEPLQPTGNVFLDAFIIGFISVIALSVFPWPVWIADMANTYTSTAEHTVIIIGIGVGMALGDLITFIFAKKFRVWVESNPANRLSNWIVNHTSIKHTASPRRNSSVLGMNLANSEEGWSNARTFVFSLLAGSTPVNDDAVVGALGFQKRDIKSVFSGLLIGKIFMAFYILTVSYEVLEATETDVKFSVYFSYILLTVAFLVLIVKETKYSWWQLSLILLGLLTVSGIWIFISYDFNPIEEYGFINTLTGVVLFFYFIAILHIFIQIIIDAWEKWQFSKKVSAVSSSKLKEERPPYKEMFKTYLKRLSFPAYLFSFIFGLYVVIAYWDDHFIRGLGLLISGLAILVSFQKTISIHRQLKKAISLFINNKTEKPIFSEQVS
ncbi:MAG: hypothetical protein ACETVN_01345 [Asgard group archaeon]